LKLLSYSGEVKLPIYKLFSNLIQAIHLPVTSRPRSDKGSVLPDH